MWRKYLLLAAFIGEYPKWVVVAQVALGPYAMCNLARDMLMGHSDFWSLKNSGYQNVYLELQLEGYGAARYTLAVRLILNQFCQFPFCIDHQLWLPDEKLQLLLEYGKDWLNWPFKFLIDRNVNSHIYNQFTSALNYPVLQHFTKLFNCLTSSWWQGQEILHRIRTLAVNHTPMRICSNNDWSSVRVSL